MAGLMSPQSQAGVMSFYDSPTKGPKLNPKVILVIIAIFAIAVLIAGRFIYVH